jgi:hypothetical protein
LQKGKQFDILLLRPNNITHLDLTTSTSHCLNDEMDLQVSLCANEIAKFQLNSTYLIRLPERVLFYLRILIIHQFSACLNFE